MPGKSGMEVAQLLREKDFDGVIIFVSSHKDYVYDVFKLEAFRFLVKPAEKEKMYEALDASFEKISKLDEEYLLIDVDKNKVEKVKLNHVIYIETYGRKTIIYLKDKEIESMTKMKHFEDTLSSHQFFRPHLSYIINFLHVKEFDKSQIMMKNKHSIPLSRLKVNQFKTSYFDYIRSI
jgi:DNA-binding LytR/AlgR family response regulator